MLTINVVLEEGFDESTQKFVVLSSYPIELEHSLASLSKWESKYGKPFLGREDKTQEETLWYITDCMILGKIPPEEILAKITQKQADEIVAYISSPQTATTITKRNRPGPKQLITAEVVYAWMVALRIPFEAQYWHLNKLLMLIDVVGEQQQPGKKVPRSEAAKRQAALNAKRRAEMGSKG